MRTLAAIVAAGSVLGLLGLAADTTHRDVGSILRARWPTWVGDKDSVQATDLDEEAGNPALRNDDAAACAALIQTVQWASRKQQLTQVPRGRLIDPGDPAFVKVLENSYKAGLRKQAAIPHELWATDAPHFAAVTQSGDRTGDCWLMAPTGWMVKNRPDVVKSVVTPIGDGRYRVTFPSRVVVEVGVPTQTELLAVNALPTLKDGLWLPVIKEAMGEVLGAHNPKKAQIESESLRLNGGSLARMMEHWTGHRTQTTRLVGKAPADEVRAKIVDALARKALIGAGTNKEPGGNIPPNHAYAIFGFDADRDMVITWNPWHNDFTPKGPSNRENGYARKKGVAEIPLADFVQIFNALQIETDEAFDATAPRKRVEAAQPDPAAATR